METEYINLLETIKQFGLTKELLVQMLETDMDTEQSFSLAHFISNYISGADVENDDQYRRLLIATKAIDGILELPLE